MSTKRKKSNLKSAASIDRRLARKFKNCSNGRDTVNTQKHQSDQVSLPPAEKK